MHRERKSANFLIATLLVTFLLQPSTTSANIYEEGGLPIESLYKLCNGDKGSQIACRTYIAGMLRAFVFVHDPEMSKTLLRVCVDIKKADKDDLDWVIEAFKKRVEAHQSSGGLERLRGEEATHIVMPAMSFRFARKCPGNTAPR